jgi:hypothetical protein
LHNAPDEKAAEKTIRFHRFAREAASVHQLRAIETIHKA